MDGNGEKHLILCRVILGNVEKVEVGSQQYYPSKLEFDTGADDLNNPKWYIVWSSNMNRHIIPEFVVSYKSSRQVQGKCWLFLLMWLHFGGSFCMEILVNVAC